MARAIDRWVWYAGWADKIAQVLGSSNPVAASYFNFTIPEPTGVVGVVAPETSSLLGLVSRLAPPLVAGNSVVVLASESRPLPAVTLTEVLATSDVPGGVVNVLTGLKPELVPVMAGHVDVDAMDVWGVPGRPPDRRRAGRRRQRQAPRPATRGHDRRTLRLARRPRLRATRVDRRLPRDEDRLASDRGLTWRSGRSDGVARTTSATDGPSSVEPGSRPPRGASGRRSTTRRRRGGCSRR